MADYGNLYVYVINAYAYVYVITQMYMSLNRFLVNDLHMTITYVKVVMISCSALVKLQFV